MPAAAANGTIIRWAGSKRRLLPQLSAFWSPSYARYVEPFAGSAALFFVLEPESAVLSDMNPELVNGLKQLARQPRQLHSALTKLPRSKATYISLRATDPTALPRFDRAVRFFYLNRFCFNGLYRTNASGGFNVPYAATRTGGFPCAERFAYCARLLRRAKLSRGDFEDTISNNVGMRDFVYLDPPFAVSNRRLFRQYGPDTFGLNDLDRLRASLHLIDKRGATFVLSYADSPEARKYLSAWHYRRVFVQRNVAGFSSDRRQSVELIVSNVQTWPEVQSCRRGAHAALHHRRPRK